MKYEDCKDLLNETFLIQVLKFRYWRSIYITHFPSSILFYNYVGADSTNKLVKTAHKVQLNCIIPTRTLTEYIQCHI
jgi:hypothetical protein